MTQAVTTNFQRVGSLSNAHVGRDFESIVAKIFTDQGYPIQSHFRIEIGHGSRTKMHNFDLGCSDPAILIECKSHKWTTGGNIPSAKMTVWNEAMYYFYLAPASFRKCLCVLRDNNSKTGSSLAEHYLRLHAHLVPSGVEIWEIDIDRSDYALLYTADVTIANQAG